MSDSDAYRGQEGRPEEQFRSNPSRPFYEFTPFEQELLKEARAQTVAAKATATYVGWLLAITVAGIILGFIASLLA